jgi:hypothetical protein
LGRVLQEIRQAVESEISIGSRKSRIVELNSFHGHSEFQGVFPLGHENVIVELEGVGDQQIFGRAANGVRGRESGY